MGIVAKPLLNDKLWVITDGNKRFGSIKVNDDRTVTIRLENRVISEAYLNIEELSKKYQIHFETFHKQPTQSIRVIQDKNNNYFINSLPINSRPYNIVIDAKTRNILFTKEEDSVTYYCAGWFRVKTKRGVKIELCPRLLTTQRKQAIGPYETYEQAKLFSSPTKTLPD